jgi:putative Holliday junction resolvase
MTSPGSATAPPRIILAFDFGLRRIGIATGDTVSGIARPLRTLNTVSGGPDWAAIGKEIRDHSPALLLVGAPYNEDGSHSAMTEAAAEFATQLAARFPLPVEQVDERYSSIEATEQLRQRRADGLQKRRVQKGDVDSAAAAVILQSWLRLRGSL